MAKNIGKSSSKEVSSSYTRIHSYVFLLLFLFAGATAFAQADSLSASGAQADGAAAGAPAAGAEGIPTDAEAINAGKALFNNNCSQCHAIGAKLVGPALGGVTERRPLPWLISFIKNSQKVIASGDDYAVALYNQYNKIQMPPFNYSDDQIETILAYIQAESNAPPAEVAGPTVGSDQPGVGGDSGGIPSTYLLAILGGLVIILLLILVVLVLIISLMNKLLKQRTDLDRDQRAVVEDKFDAGKIFKNKNVIGILVFIFLAVGAKATVDGLFSIGIQQGYAPKQPIAFSHALHAGQYEIDCQYCHTGVMKGKSANIPSANICMNCHNAIKPESPEIQKIYAAVDFNPETGQYGNDVKPIEWVRVHNLPDLAYFNHAQHVNVGGVQCQTCHGPIQEMQVVSQHAPLTMGWCINCHRETTLNTKGNDYYDKLVELHDAHSNEPMKVKDIGGLECSKCHY